jgi:predicted GNAT superfamily acetyltransferase
LVVVTKGRPKRSSDATKRSSPPVLTLDGMVETRVQRTLSTRLLATWDELAGAVDIVLSIWGESAVSLASPSLLRTLSHYGNPVLGAFDGDRLCGVSIAFLAAEPEVHLHSHITGVLPSHQHLGVGFALKDAQRQWCVEHDIGLVTWTFDPMLARNAHFNMRKLGAVSRRLLPAFYGEMDDDLNRGDDTDRLEVSWPVPAAGAGRCDEVVGVVAIPPDYHALRAADPVGASEWRARVRDELLAAFADGLEVVDFDRARGYLLARR